jgi:hypothetical protein
MPDEVILDVTTIEENVTVETTAGDVVEVKVVATQGAAATVTVGTTTTGAAGSSASVTNSGTTSAAVFNFTIPRGDTGAAGASGGSSTAWRYRAKTNATSGYPTNGHLLWDNATQLSATEILVSHLDDEGSDIEFFLSFFLEGQKIFIQNRDDSSQNQVWEITGTPTVTGANTSTAYYTFPVTLVSSAGAPFTNNHSILFGSIAAAVNAVTSATTSDYTAELNLAQVNTGVLVVTDGVTIETLDYNFGTGSAQALKDALEIASADITDATSDGDANKEKVLKTDSQGSLTVTNAFGVNASFGSSLVVGDGDSVNGRYDIFNNSSHLQWYSDSAPYGEREFVITTQNLTSSGSWGYKYPAASGTFAVTASTTGVPDKLTDCTIAGTLALNSTSYTYGIGAAATHRTALGLTTLATTTPAANVATFLETPTSSNLAAAVTGETGSGALVFGTSPTIVAPTISGSAAFTSTTRPTSAGTGAPEATSLITRDDGDARYLELLSPKIIVTTPSDLARASSGTGSSSTVARGLLSLRTGTSGTGAAAGIALTNDVANTGTMSTAVGSGLSLMFGPIADGAYIGLFYGGHPASLPVLLADFDNSGANGFSLQFRRNGAQFEARLTWRINGTASVSAWESLGVGVASSRYRGFVFVTSTGIKGAIYRGGSTSTSDTIDYSTPVWSRTENFTFTGNLGNWNGVTYAHSGDTTCLVSRFETLNRFSI